MKLLKKILNKQLEKIDNFNKSSDKTPTISINIDNEYLTTKNRIEDLRKSIQNTKQ
ncbi:hypothetical protein KCL46_000970 [Clostridium perfringens]|nr:hypothetical protein [Clostridium perfringens]